MFFNSVLSLVDMRSR